MEQAGRSSRATVLDVGPDAADPGASRDVKPFQILTFDGGGLKGLFAAALLADVEQQLGVTVADHLTSSSARRRVG